jgi:excisionase family DNA binding protein
MSDQLPDDLLTPREAAKLARVSQATLYRWLQAGKMSSYDRLGRLFVSRADVEAVYRPRRITKTPEPPPTPRARELRDRHTREVLERAGFRY